MVHTSSHINEILPSCTDSHHALVHSTEIIQSQIMCILRLMTFKSLTGSYMTYLRVKTLYSSTTMILLIQQRITHKTDSHDFVHLTGGGIPSTERVLTASQLYSSAPGSGDETLFFTGHCDMERWCH